MEEWVGGEGGRDLCWMPSMGNCIESKEAMGEGRGGKEEGERGGGRGREEGEGCGTRGREEK